MWFSHRGAAFGVSSAAARWRWSLALLPLLLSLLASLLSLVVVMAMRETPGQRGGGRRVMTSVHYVSTSPHDRQGGKDALHLLLHLATIKFSLSLSH